MAGQAAGFKLPAFVGSSWFRCFVVFALGGLCGRIFDAWAAAREARKNVDRKPEKLKLRTLRREEILETEECAVCLEELAPKFCVQEFANHACCRLVCGHSFHQDCIEKWLARDKRQSCPVCRMDAASQDHVDEGLRRRAQSCK